MEITSKYGWHTNYNILTIYTSGSVSVRSNIYWPIQLLMTAPGPDWLSLITIIIHVVSAPIIMLLYYYYYMVGGGVQHYTQVNYSIDHRLASIIILHNSKLYITIFIIYTLELTGAYIPITSTFYDIYYIYTYNEYIRVCVRVGNNAQVCNGRYRLIVARNLLLISLKWVYYTCV